YQYFRIYALGEGGSIGNIIYSNWEKQDLSGMKCTFDNTFNGLDFGFADDPTAFIRLHLDNKRKIIYIFDEFALRGLFIDDIAKELHDRITSEYITCDSAEPRSVQDLKRNGIKALP